MNIYGDPLKPCSFDPLTGYYRDGYCRGEDGLPYYPKDVSKHYVCAEMDNDFLDYTESMGNRGLKSVVSEGERWCLCEDRYYEAYRDGYAPKVIPESTTRSTKSHIKKVIREQVGGKQFLYNLSNFLIVFLTSFTVLYLIEIVSFGFLSI